MRKVAAIACAGALAITLAGCGGQEPEATESQQGQSQESQLSYTEKVRAAGLPTIDEINSYREILPLEEMQDLTDRTGTALDAAINGDVSQLLSLQKEASALFQDFTKVTVPNSLSDLHSEYRDAVYNTTQAITSYTLAFTTTDPTDIGGYLEQGNTHMEASTESLYDANDEMADMMERLESIQ